MQDLVFAFLEFAKQPPGSGIIVVLVSMTLTTISNLATKRFSDVRRMNRIQAEVKRYQEMEKRAKESGNEKLLRKVKRRKSYIDRIQRELMTSRCKPSLMFMIPMLIVFTMLRGFFSVPDASSPTGAVDVVVAVLPFSVHKLLPFLNGFIGIPVAGGFGMWFWPFYFLVGLGLGQIIQRIMGVNVMTTT